MLNENEIENQIKNLANQDLDKIKKNLQNCVPFGRLLDFIEKKSVLDEKEKKHIENCVNCERLLNKLQPTTVVAAQTKVARVTPNWRKLALRVVASGLFVFFTSTIILLMTNRTLRKENDETSQIKQKITKLEEQIKAEKLLNSAFLLARIGQYEKAAECFQAFCSAIDVSEGNFRDAVFSFYYGDFNKCVNVLDNVLANCSNRQKTHLRSALKIMGTCAKEAAELQSKSNTDKRRELFTKSIQAYRRLLSLPKDKDVNNIKKYLSWSLYRRGDIQESIKLSQELLQEPPTDPKEPPTDDPKLLLNYALALREIGNDEYKKYFDRGFEITKRLVEIEPDNHQKQFSLAIFYGYLRNRNLTLKHLKLAVKRPMSRIYARSEPAFAWLRTDTQFKKAIQLDHKKVIESFFKETLNNLLRDMPDVFVVDPS